jgi:hypothetical protein
LGESKRKCGKGAVVLLISRARRSSGSSSPVHEASIRRRTPIARKTGSVSFRSFLILTTDEHRNKVTGFEITAERGAA